MVRGGITHPAQRRVACEDNGPIALRTAVEQIEHVVQLGIVPRADVGAEALLARAD